MYFSIIFIIFSKCLTLSTSLIYTNYEQVGIGEPCSNRTAWGNKKVIYLYIYSMKIGADSKNKLPVPYKDGLLDFDSWGPSLYGLIVMECIDYKGVYLKKIEEYLNAIADAPYWCGKNLTRIDLSTSLAASVLSQAYYMIGDKFADEVKSKVFKALNTQILDPMRSIFYKNDHAMIHRNHWINSTGNESPVCWAGVILTAMVAISNSTERAYFVNSGISSLSYFVENGWTPDGFYKEGIAYFNYAIATYISIRQIIMEASNGQQDLFLINPLMPRNLAYCLEYPMTDISGGAFSDDHYNGYFDKGVQNYIDCTISSNNKTNYDYTYVAHNLVGYTIMHDLLQNPQNRFQLSPNKQVKINYALNSIRTYYPISGVLVSRAFTNQVPKKIQIAGTFKLLGGVTNSSGGGHNHNDAGSYSIMKNGVKIAGEVGGPKWYTPGDWLHHHYDSIVTNSYGHPVPVVDHKLQVPSWFYSYTNSKLLKVVSTSFTEDQDSIIYDLTKAYNVSSLLSLKRENFFIRKNTTQSIIITDDVQFSRPTFFETAITSLGKWVQKAEIFHNNNHHYQITGTLSLDNSTIHVAINALHPFYLNVTNENSNGWQFTRIGIILSNPSIREKVQVTYH